MTIFTDGHLAARQIETRPPLPGRIFQRIKSSVRLASIAPSADAFLVSFPKSGRTWLRFILSNYFEASAGLAVSVNLHTMFNIIPNYDLDPVRGVPAFQYQGRVPRILVTHRAYSRTLFRCRPVIFMVRDPRDVMVSAYFHAARQKHRFSGELTEFLSDPEQGIRALIRYLNAWAAQLPRHPHLILSYERLTDNVEAVTANVLSFLGCDIDSDALRQAIEASRFEVMRDLEKLEGIPGHAYDRADGESLRMRKGKAGGFVDYLKPQDVEIISLNCSSGLTPAAKTLVDATGVSFL